MNRKSSLAALLGVVAVSIVFGMILGGRLNAPPVMHAAPPVAAAAFPAATTPPARTIALPDFSEIAQDTLPAVVGVQNTTVDKNGDDSDEGDTEGQGDQFFRFFFGPGGPQDRRIHPQTPRLQRRVSSGSGFIISPDGFILTNNHVVEGASKLQVTLDTGEKYVATVIGTDPMIDLGLIKIDPNGKKLPTLALGDSDALKIGQWVMAIGNPFALERTVTVGVVSGKKRQVGTPGTTTVPALANFIQTDAAINFGNSGGPLIDGQGRVIGINTMIQRGELAEGIGFAIPINEARKAAEELRASGSVKRGYLGIVMNPTPINEKSKTYYKLPDTNGVIVADVSPPDGPAAKAGLRKNDVIRKIDGNTVKDNQDLLAMIASRKPGETVKLEVVRGSETVKIDVKLSSRPVFGTSNEGDEQKPEGDELAPSSGEGLGITVQGLSPAERQQLKMDADSPGVVIKEVDPESDAAEEGLTPREIITAIDDKPVRSVADWKRIVGALKPGETVKVDVSVFGGRVTQNEILFLTVPKPNSK